MLEHGGIFVSDDVGDNPAFVSFSECLNITPIYLSIDGKYIGILLKE